MALLAVAPSAYDYTIFIKDTDNYSSIKIALESLKISDNGALLILSFERWRAYQYWNGSEYRIGYNSSSSDTNINGLTEDQAYNLFRQNLKTAEKKLRSEVGSKITHLTQNQYDALVSFCYSVGNISKAIIGSTIYDLRTAIRNAVDADSGIESTTDAWNNVASLMQSHNVKGDQRVAEASILMLGDYSDLKNRSWLRTEGIQDMRIKYPDGYKSDTKDGKSTGYQKRQAEFIYYVEATKFLPGMSEVAYRAVVSRTTNPPTKIPTWETWSKGTGSGVTGYKLQTSASSSKL
tara:strand:- start:659 stop:1534 length:876 start_codon:yes stop_codon:yes gene_type:complete